MKVLGGGSLRVGHHKIGACAEIGQTRIRGDGGSKNQKKSDIIYVRSLTTFSKIYSIPNHLPRTNFASIRYDVRPSQNLNEETKIKK